MLAVAAFLVATVVRRAPLRVRPLHAAAAAPRGSPLSNCWSRRSTGRWPARCSTSCCRRAHAPVPDVPRRVPRGDPAGHGQSRARRRRRVRGADGAAAQAVPLVRRSCCPALVVYRAVYYLLPFCARARRAGRSTKRTSGGTHLARAGAWLGALTEQVTPRVLAAALVLLRQSSCSVSGATPASPGRLDLLDRVLPLGVIEASHFIGSVAGAGLLVLSQGLARRLDAAYYLSSRPDRRRHGRVAAEGLRLRGGDAAAAGAGGRCTAPDRRSIAAPRSSTRGSRRLAGGGGRRARGVGLAGPVRLQARRLLARAVVAVRAARRGLALPARVGRRGRRGAARRRRAPAAARAARGRRAHRRRPRRGGHARSPRRPRPRRTSSTCATRRCSSTRTAPAS